uniref:Protein NDUFAF4 homolog n=1 Tax=Tabanus bromius TaxID=304241 RepID=A0A0K8TQU9_TABBR
MGFVASKISRKIKRFNVESRAHSLLDKDSLRPPPKFETTLRDIQRTLEENPNFATKESLKDSSLNERLKQVYVTTPNEVVVVEDAPRGTAGKPLPTSRTSDTSFQYGITEPTNVPRGKCTLSQAMTFLNDYAQDPSEWTVNKIADVYKLKTQTVDKIVLYFKVFQLYIPDKKKTDELLGANKQKMLEGDGKNEHKNS